MNKRGRLPDPNTSPVTPGGPSFTQACANLRQRAAGCRA